MAYNIQPYPAHSPLLYISRLEVSESLVEDTGGFSSPSCLPPPTQKKPSEGEAANKPVVFAKIGDKQSIFQLDVCWGGRAQRDTAGRPHGTLSLPQMPSKFAGLGSLGDAPLRRVFTRYIDPLAKVLGVCYGLEWGHVELK